MINRSPILSDMKNANTALVTFAKSAKQPRDLAELAGQIDVFATDAKLFDDAITPIRSADQSSKHAGRLFG